MDPEVAPRTISGQGQSVIEYPCPTIKFRRLLANAVSLGEIVPLLSFALATVYGHESASRRGRQFTRCEFFKVAITLRRDGY